jgi:hypothetical protein
MAFDSAKARAATAQAKAQTSSPSREDVAKRAYELFLARGCTHGHDQEDWLQAERELGVVRNSEDKGKTDRLN